MTRDPESDFALCDDTFGELTDHRPRRFDLSKVPTEKRTVIMVWHFYGIILNSGFEGVLSRDISGDPNLQLLIDAFAAIGCSELLGDVEVNFDDGTIPSDLVNRVEKWQSLNANLRSELDEKLFAAEEEITLKLADYIRHNWTAVHPKAH